MHSHYGVDPAPGLKGTDDTNSLKAPILPWLRSLDGINTHDLAFNLSIAGGITTSMILPGSAGNIGLSIFSTWTAEQGLTCRGTSFYHQAPVDCRKYSSIDAGKLAGVV
jgi:imidazolonepropionase-like amidohydrolase